MNRFYGLLCCLVLGAGLWSCASKPCIQDGTWTWTNTYLPFCPGTTIEFGENNIAYMVVPDCYSACSSGGDRGLVYKISYNLDNTTNTLTLTFMTTDGEVCSVPTTHSTVPSPIAGTFSCGDNAASLVTGTYTYNLTR